MSAALNYDPTDPDKMNLPRGMTCGNCVHIDRCKAMFGHVETDTRCDWSPSRFRPAPTPSQRLQRCAAELAEIAANPPREINGPELARLSARILSVAAHVSMGERNSTPGEGSAR